MEERDIFAGLKGSRPEEIFGKIKTPCYIIDEEGLKRNGAILKQVSEKTGCRILLAQKAFSNFSLYPVLSGSLSGTEASGLFEARLGKEEMPEGEVHVFCGAYREDEFEELLQYADHIVFNSVRQLEKFGKRAKDAKKSIGVRINPECSTQEGHAIYDPCAPGSRLGITRREWDRNMTEELFGLLDGLHFHTLCEQGADALEITLRAVEEKFGDVLSAPQIKWLNMGGGHHVTRADYDIPLLEKCISYAQKKWNLTVYLEPGEACALNAGYFATRVLDVVKNGEKKIAILDGSAACHMPDVIEMPYIPPLYDAEGIEMQDMDEEESVGQRSAAGGEVPWEAQPWAEKIQRERPQNIDKNAQYRYRLGGPTCLSGDVIGEYRFPGELQEGDLLLFGDMAIYTTCKNNTFNGMPLPDILLLKCDKSIEKIKSFGYEDFKGRLG